MKKYTVTVNGDREGFDTIEEVRDYLVDMEDGFVHSDLPGHLKVTVTDGEKKTEAYVATGDEAWAVDSDDFELFNEGILM